MLKQIRNRAFMYLSPEVAAAANMRLSELQQFCAGHYHPTDEQLEALARRMRLA